MPSYVANLNELTAPVFNDYFLVSDTSDSVDKDKKMQLAKMALKNGTPVTGQVASWTDANQVQSAGYLAVDVVRRSGVPTAGQVASWVDGNTVQAGGYLVADVVRKTGSPTANNAVQWSAANIVVDAGFPVADIARLSQAQTYTALMTAPNGIRSGFSSINNDSFIQFTPPATGGLVMVWCDNSSGVAGMANFRRSGYIVSVFAGVNIVFQAGALNGTTGTAGKVTVGNTGDIYIENRLGAVRTFYWMLFL